MNFIKDVLANAIVTVIENALLIGGVYFLVKFAKSNKDKKQNHALTSC